MHPAARIYRAICKCSRRSWAELMRATACSYHELATCRRSSSLLRPRPTLAWQFGAKGDKNSGVCKTNEVCVAGNGSCVTRLRLARVAPLHFSTQLHLQTNRYTISCSKPSRHKCVFKIRKHSGRDSVCRINCTFAFSRILHLLLLPLRQYFRP